MVAKKEHYGKYIEYNIGQKDNNIINVERILDIVKYKNPKFKWVKEKNNKIYEARLLDLDTAKFYSNFKFMPKTNAEETINETVDWYIEYSRGNWLPIDEIIESYFYGK